MGRVKYSLFLIIPCERRSRVHIVENVWSVNFREFGLTNDIGDDDVLYF